MNKRIALLLTLFCVLIASSCSQKKDKQEESTTPVTEESAGSFEEVTITAEMTDVDSLIGRTVTFIESLDAIPKELLACRIGEECYPGSPYYLSCRCGNPPVQKPQTCRDYYCADGTKCRTLCESCFVVCARP